MAATSSNKPSQFWSSELSAYFVAGGAAGAASRTVVSPLERLKIIQQVQSRAAPGNYQGVWSSLVRMFREEGFAGLMRGNGINCLRIVPYSAVQFTTYEQIKKWLTRDGSPLDTPKRLCAGALAGITSVSTTYPLDLVRARLSIATASIPMRNTGKPPVPDPSLKRSLTRALHTVRPQYTAHELTVWGMTLKIMREEGGVRGLYRGVVTTAVGVAPYVATNFASYELLRARITPPGKNSVWRKLTCGALAGSISQTLTYPFDVLRRKMQVVGMSSGPLDAKYTSAFDALRTIIRTEGVKGLYRGIVPNLLKVAPSIATSFYTYELIKEALL